MREERKLRVSDNRVLRRIFGLERERDVTREWRRLPNVSGVPMGGFGCSKKKKVK